MNSPERTRRLLWRMGLGSLLLGLPGIGFIFYLALVSPDGTGTSFDLLLGLSAICLIPAVFFIPAALFMHLPRRVQLLAVALVLYMLAALTIIMGLRDAWLIYRSQSWLVTTGRIVKSTIDVTRSTSSRGLPGVSYFPSVAYDYAVQGTTYTGWRIAFDVAGTGNRAAAEARLSPYPLNTTVEVHYDPDSPGDSTLEMTGDVPFTTYIGCAIGLFMLLGAIGLQYAAFR